MNDAWKAAGLLVASNAFMTTAWYGHLRYRSVNVWTAIFVSWGIALFEYMLQVPANRIGHQVLSAYQLKVMQEAITLAVFVVFARFALDERLTARHALSFVLIFVAVAIAFRK
jgi:uncharacterized protein (DUF486 family)